MRSWIRARMTYANVMVTIVAFIVLGGSAYAAKEVGKNSVDTNAIQKNAVTGAKIKNNSVGGGDLKSDSVAGSDIRLETLVGKDVPASTLDGKSADQLQTRWALVNEQGQIERQTGGFSTVNCYQANGNCYIDIGTDARPKGLSATIGINNEAGSPILSGEIGVAPCAANTVACQPENTEAPNVIVVAPRDSAGAPFGNPPTAGQAARFYVFVESLDGSASGPPATTTTPTTSTTTTTPTTSTTEGTTTEGTTTDGG